MGWEIALMAASTGLSAVQTISAGRERQRQEEIRQRQLALEARQARVQELQERQQVAKEHRAMTSRNMALAAAKGFDAGTSGSWLAIKKESDRELGRDVGNIAMFGAARQANAQNSILASKSAASAARTSSYISAGQTLFSGGMDIYKAIK